MLEEHTQAMKMTAILSLTTHVTIGLLINKRLRIPKGQTNAHVLPFRMWTQTPDCKHNSCKSYGCSKGLWYMEVKHIDTVLLLL
jgi:hypothetical protein